MTPRNQFAGAILTLILFTGMMLGVWATDDSSMISLVELTILVIASAYLWLRVFLHYGAANRAEEIRLRAIEREFPPRAFEVSSIALQISRVRQDYAAVAHRRQRAAHHQPDLLANARQTISRFAYFRHTEHEAELQIHDAS